MVSRVIKDTVNQRLIRAYDPDAGAKAKRYVPPLVLICLTETIYYMANKSQRYVIYDFLNLFLLDSKTSLY